MDGRKRRLPEGAQSTIKKNFSRSGAVRQAAKGSDEDSEEEVDDEEEQKMNDVKRKEGKKTKEEVDEEVEAAHLSDASGDEEVGERGKVKQRDRTRLHIAALRKQGINLDEDAEDKDEDDEDNDAGLFREHLNNTGRRMEDMDTSNPFHAGKVQTDYEAPSREKLESLFGRENDDGPVEEFTMGTRSSKYLYGRAGQVLEENQDANDAWLEEWGAGTPKTEVPRTGDDGLDAFNRIHKKKKTEAKDQAPIRHSTDPLQNLEIVLSHLKPGETILKALKRLGPTAGAGPAMKKKNVRTKPSNTAMQTESTATTDSQGGGDARAFAELTDAAQTLLEGGEIEIYSESFESVSRALAGMRAKKKQAEEEAAARMAAANQQPQRVVLHWQYRWNASDPKVHGPFVGSEMEEWKADGYFSEQVQVQRVGPGHNPLDSLEWVPATSVLSFTRPSS